MIDTDKYEGHAETPWKIYYNKWDKSGWWIDSIARGGVGNGNTVCRLLGKTQNKNPTAKLIQDAPLLLAEVKRLREENEQLRKADWEYECLWTWLDENTNLLNTIEPLVEEWKKEMIE